MNYADTHHRLRPRQTIVRRLLAVVLVPVGHWHFPGQPRGISVLGPPGTPATDGRWGLWTLSLSWLDPSGHRLGRALTLTGAPARPEREAIGLVGQLRHTIATEGPLHVRARIAIHRAAGSWTTAMVDPPCREVPSAQGRPEVS